MKLPMPMSLCLLGMLAFGCGKNKQTAVSTAPPPSATAPETAIAPTAATVATPASAPTAAASASAPTPKPAEYGNPVTAPLDYLSAVGKGEEIALKQINLAYVTQAIQQFNAGEGRLPKDINELMSEHYLGKLPALPPGYELRYDPADGTVRVARKLRQIGR